MNLPDINPQAPVAANEEKEMLSKLSTHSRKVFGFAVVAGVLVAGLVALTLSLRSGSAASSPRSGELHVTKECSQFTGAAGDFCTITGSNIKEIEAGSKVIYASAAGTPTAGFLDTDVVLAVGPGNNRANGHCKVDVATGVGLCTFSGGTGKFTHFQARVDVTPPTDPAPTANWHWDGTYSFRPK